MSTITPEDQKNTQRILAIDDYEPILRLYKVAFEQQYPVDIAKNFIEVKKLGNKENYDFIVTDYNFPDVTFDDLFLYVKENFKKAKVIVVSGTEKISNIEEKYGTDCLAVLSKPVDLFYILNLVKGA